MGARQASVEETRERIAKATYELHATIGPARTTISAIADRAGVQRHTVYAHFPDLTSLFQACTAHGLRVQNPPDPERWRSIADPGERVREALGELYPFWRENARLYGNVFRDMVSFPETLEGARQFFDLMDAWTHALLEAWQVDEPRRPALEAAVRHAVAFETWESLTSGGLSDADTRDAMSSFVMLMAGRPTAA
jgi:AcrR family transcriptional regulator